MRQLTYSTVRFGAYEKLKESVTAQNPTPSVFTLVGIACASGVAGGIAGNPADLLNVRMQNDASLPVEKRRNYKNAVDGIIRMAREEGPKSLFRGVGPNSIRAALMTASQLATYDTFKGLLLARTPMQDNLTTHFTASLLAGLVATTVCSPFDVIKTRIMSSHEKHNIVQLITNTFKNEGFGWMFRGWVPSFMRLGPHTIFTFIFLEQHKSLYRKFIGADDA